MDEQRQIIIVNLLKEVTYLLATLVGLLDGIAIIMLVSCSKPENPVLPTTQCWECQFNGPGPPPPNNIIDSCGVNSDIQSWVIEMERKQYECKEKSK